MGKKKLEKEGLKNMTLWENIYPWERVNQQPKCRVLERDWHQKSEQCTECMYTIFVISWGKTFEKKEQGRILREYVGNGEKEKKGNRR